MLIWPVIVIGVAIFILILTGSPVEIDGIPVADQAQSQVVYLVLLGIALVLFSVARLLSSGGRRTLTHAAVWLGLVAGLTTAYVFRDQATMVVERLQSKLMPSVALSQADGEEAKLTRGWDGHYRATAEVNGQTMQMLVDTGSSMVLIRYEEAVTLGIDVEKLKFTIPVNTANGRSEVAPVVLSSIKIGPVAVFNVPAAVARAGRLESDLLGLSFMDMLYEVTFRGETLILRQHRNEPDGSARTVSVQ